MTRAQTFAIARIQRNQFEYDKSGRREVKELRLKQIGKRVLVYIVVGYKGDEKTMASVLCRDRGCFVVGPRGGIEALSKSKHGTKADARKHPLIYGWEN